MSRIATAVARSVNVKLTRDPKGRPVSSTWAAQVTCPASCPLREAGCYAEKGRAGMVTRRLNRAAEGRSPLEVARVEAAAIDALPARGQPLRLHVVGDAPSKGAALVLWQAAGRFLERSAAAAARFLERHPERERRKRAAVWTYTHAWGQVPRAVWGQAVSVLASVETLAQARAARRRGYAPARVLDAFPQGRQAWRAGGVRWVPCPQQTGAAQDCESCRLCWRADELRDAGVGIAFRRH